jgi:1-deoxy-D-xylulose-5-phosphate synthase
VRIGWPDQFIEHGTVPILRAKHGLTVEATVQKILSSLKVEAKTPLEVVSAA